ncbi:MAG: hypothetical protein ACQEUZ_16975, partial [Pseudomonadota bacterium]
MKRTVLRPRAACGAIASLAAGLLAVAAQAAELPRGPGIIAAACPGPGAARLLLLPEDAGEASEAPEGTVTVTGAYTATDRRDGDRPKPVGFYIHRGELVSLEFGRMDGVLLVAPDGAARIAVASDVPLAGERRRLTSLSGRRAFARAAAEAGVSVLQSHLLIRDGALDLRPVADAPVAERRILFQTREGALALWQSGGRALTLHEAASELAARHAP